MTEPALFLLVACVLIYLRYELFLQRKELRKLQSLLGAALNIGADVVDEHLGSYSMGEAPSKLAASPSSSDFINDLKLPRRELALQREAWAAFERD